MNRARFGARPSGSVCFRRGRLPGGAVRRGGRVDEFGCESMLFLLRILIMAGLLAGLAYGALHALATWVEPEQREISVPVDPPRPRAAP